MRLKDKGAIITGAGSGIGKASALIFAKEGASVVVADINEEMGKETTDEILASGGKAIFIKTDISVETDIINMVKTAVESFGKLNILFNVAGYPQKPTMIEDLSNEVYDRVMAVNVKGVWMSCKYAVAELRKTKGVIINVASVGGLRPRPGTTAYGPSKGAVISMTKACAVEFAPDVRVNVINPGPVNTPMLPKFLDVFNEDILKEIKDGTALGELVQPEDIAYAGVFLASDEALKITGAELNVDSGLYIGRSKN